MLSKEERTDAFEVISLLLKMDKTNLSIMKLSAQALLMRQEMKETEQLKDDGQKAG